MPSVVGSSGFQNVYERPDSGLGSPQPAYPGHLEISVVPGLENLHGNSAPIWGEVSSTNEAPKHGPKWPKAETLTVKHLKPKP